MRMKINAKEKKRHLKKLKEDRDGRLAIPILGGGIWTI